MSGPDHLMVMQAEGTLPLVDLLVGTGEPVEHFTGPVARVQGEQIPLVYSDVIEQAIAASDTPGAAVVVEQLLDSILPLLFMDRERARMLDGTNHQVGRVVSLARACIALLSHHGIEQLIACSTPHRLSTYVLGRVAELMGIPLYIVDRSAIPHRYWTMRGFDREPVADSVTAEPAELSERTLAFLAEQRAAQDFEPSYMRSQQQRYRRRHYSIAGELRSLARGPWRPWDPLQIWRKRSLFRRYEELCERRLPASPEQIVFFLHYQPERTTLPEGGRYASQELAVLALADAVPADWIVSVREHPSTWMLRYSRGGRTQESYDNMASHPRVRFVRSDEPVNALIDGSLAVATSTGSVGFQALCRGVPALAFGCAAYTGHPWCYRIRQAADAALAVEALKAGGRGPRPDADRVASNYAREVEAMTTEEPPIGPGGTRRSVRLTALTTQVRRFLETTGS